MLKTFYFLPICILIQTTFYILTYYASYVDQLRSRLIITDKSLDLLTTLPIIIYEFIYELQRQGYDLTYYITPFIFCYQRSRYLSIVIIISCFLYYTEIYLYTVHISSDGSTSCTVIEKALFYPFLMKQLND